MHAEGFSGGALKHGPFALLTQGTVLTVFSFICRCNFIGLFVFNIPAGNIVGAE